jgi:hypothetical protein
MKCCFVVWFVILGMLFGSAGVALADTFITIDFPGAPANSTVVTAVNNTTVIGNFVGTTGGYHGFKYDLATGIYTALPDPTGFTTFQPTGIDNNGDIVGIAASLTVIEQGVVVSGSTVTQLNEPAAVCCTNPNAITDASREVVGSYSVGSNLDPSNPVFFHGFAFFSNNTYTTIDFPGTGPGVLCPAPGGQICNPPGGSTSLNGISSAGIVGTFTTSVFNGQAIITSSTGWLFNRTDPNPIQISVPGAQETDPTAINNFGVIAGTFFDGSGSHGFLDTNGSFATFNAPGSSTEIAGLNDNGVIVGNYTDAGGAFHGFVDIPTAGGPTDVSSQMTVTRSGYHFNFATHHFIQTDTLTNNGAALSGPVYMVLDGLSSNATLANAIGTTSTVTPIGSPYVIAVPLGGTLASGASVSVNLQFADPTKFGFTYTTQELEGGTP